MDCWTYYSRTIDRIYWLGESAEDPVRRRVEGEIATRDGFAHIKSRSLSTASELPEEHNNARTILVRRGERGDFGRCPGTHGHLCCNYLTFNVYVGCTLGCSYCIMQSYLRNRTLEVRLPDEQAIDAIKEVCLRHPNQTVRVGTGEVGDSLLFDPWFGISADLIASLRGVPNVRFELKSKSDYVDHLLDVEHDDNVVIAFSVNPPAIIGSEEGYAAALPDRLAAAEKAQRAGYRVAFHFDPIVYGGEEGLEAYKEVARRIAEVSTRDPEWISLGTMRYPTTLRPWIESRPYGTGEFVSTADGKMRYIQRVRATIYAAMRSTLQSLLPRTPVYLCMESGAVWRHLNRVAPDQSGRIGEIMRPVVLPGGRGGGR